MFSKISIKASSTHCKDQGEICLAKIVQYVLSKLTNRIVSCSPLKVLPRSHLIYRAEILFRLKLFLKLVGITLVGEFLNQKRFPATDLIRLLLNCIAISNIYDWGNWFSLNSFSDIDYGYMASISVICEYKLPSQVKTALFPWHISLHTAGNYINVRWDEIPLEVTIAALGKNYFILKTRLLTCNFPTLCLFPILNC